MANALARETSPYLLQHRDNPVDWLPWGDEALTRARELDRPLLVSIGYSSCHWCHVMERESFEDAETAALMNERFVCVKVDREERPDVDALYMDAVQAMTGQGGWPLNVFLTPEQVPFYGGTYFPPRAAPWDAELAPGPRGGRRGVGHAARGDPRAGRQRRATAAGGALPTPPSSHGPRSLEAAVAGCARARQRQRRLGRRAEVPAGLGDRVPLGARRAAMALQSLRAMAGGGIFDQVGGGFSRYSVDATLDRPALREDALRQRAARPRLPARLPAQRRRGPTPHRRGDARLGAARDARPRGWLLQRAGRRLRGRRGQFLRLDADELRAVLDDDADAAIAWFGATERGNFEGANILESRGPEPEPKQRAAHPRRAAGGAGRTRASRSRRQAPDRLERPDDRRAGRRRRRARARGLPRGGARRGRLRARALRTDDGRLLRTYNAGEARIAAYLEDHAFLLEALLVLYEATFEQRWFIAARALADTLVARFADAELGGFFSTADDGPPLIARRKELQDAPIPSGGSSAALGLIRLARSPASTPTRSTPRGSSRSLPVAGRHPVAFGHLLQALDLYLAPPREVALAGDPRARAGRRRPRGAPAAPRARRRPGDGPPVAPGAPRSTAAPRPTCASVSPAGAGHRPGALGDLLRH